MFLTPVSSYTPVPNNLHVQKDQMLLHEETFNLFPNAQEVWQLLSVGGALSPCSCYSSMFPTSSLLSNIKVTAHFPREHIHSGTFPSTLFPPPTSPHGLKFRSSSGIKFHTDMSQITVPFLDSEPLDTLQKTFEINCSD